VGDLVTECQEEFIPAVIEVGPPGEHDAPSGGLAIPAVLLSAGEHEFLEHQCAVEMDVVEVVEFP